MVGQASEEFFLLATKVLNFDDAQASEIWKSAEAPSTAQYVAERVSQTAACAETNLAMALHMPLEQPILTVPNRAQPFNWLFYKLTADHDRQDPYYGPAPEGAAAPVVNPDSKETMLSRFIADNWYQRVTLQLPQGASPDSNPINWQQNVQSLWGQGSMFPATWKEMRESFETVNNFTKRFQILEPPTYPAGITTDAQKIDYMLDVAQGTTAELVSTWTDVSVDLLRIPDGVYDFKPAFAGLLLFYLPSDIKKAPTAASPRFYVIVSANGGGFALSLFINKISPSQESLRMVQGLVGSKFSPIADKIAYYSHGLYVHPVEGGALQMTMYIDAYHHELPPQMYWDNQPNGNKRYLRVAIGMAGTGTLADSGNFYKIPKLIRVLNKGVLMAKITAVYFPNDSGAEVARRVVNPDGTINQTWWQKLEDGLTAMGLQAAEVLTCVDFATKPQVINH